MKKFMTMTVVCVLALAGVGELRAGEMDARDYVIPVSGTNSATATYTLRGSLELVRIEVPGGAQTGKVTVASGELKLFEKDAVSASATFLPRVAAHTTAGVASNAWYAAQPVAGSVSVTVKGQSAATGGVYRVRLIYRR